MIVLASQLFVMSSDIPSKLVATDKALVMSSKLTDSVSVQKKALRLSSGLRVLGLVLKNCGGLGLYIDKVVVVRC